MTLIRDINNILEYGRKTTSYKYATLLSIFDYIVEHPSETPVNNQHFIPIVYLARQFISYYYPLSFYDYSQGNLQEGMNLKVFNHINDFRSKIKHENLNNKSIAKILSTKEDGIFWINNYYDLPDPLPNSLTSLIWNVRRVILDMPLQFLHNMNNEIIRFFSIMNADTSFKLDYDDHRSKGLKQKKPSDLNWFELMQIDKTNIVIEDLTYLELAKYRFWAKDVILKAWYKFSLKKEMKKGKSEEEGNYLFKLLGYAHESEKLRDSGLISQLRTFYKNWGVMRSVITGTSLINQEYHIDHFLPWSYYPSNRFWNLYPCETQINRKKYNRIPVWTELIEENIRNNLRICLNHKEETLIFNDLKYFYVIIIKNKDIDIPKRENEMIEEDLVIFIKKEREKLSEIIPGDYLYCM